MKLETLSSACVQDSPGFEVVTGGNAVVRIGPKPFDPSRGGFSLVPLPREADASANTSLGLKVEFKARLDPEGEHMAVQNSVMGLWVTPGPGRKARPVFRIEYDRDARSKPSAHVHLHAESSELAWVYGSANEPLPSMSEIHFPVGGHRFRPTVEEVLLFLHRERLFVDWREGWRTVVESSLEEWERRQVRAAVRRNPTVAAEQLRKLGWTAAAPDGGES